MICLLLVQKSCQTATLKSAEVGAQAVYRSESASQTDPHGHLPHDPHLTRHIELESPGLVDFLNRVTDVVIKELAKNSRSHAFDGFEVNWEDQNRTVRVTRKSFDAVMEDAK